MINKDTLKAIEEDPRFKQLKIDNPALAAKMARIAARKVVQTGITTGRDPEIKAFLERNLPTVKAMAGGVKEELLSLPSTAAKSFTDYSAIGQVGKGAYDLATGAPVKQGDPIDPRLTGAFDALTSGNIRSAGSKLADYGREKSTYYMPGTLAAGTVGLVGDVIGQVPDILTGAKLGGTAAQGLMASGVGSRAASMLAQGGVDAAMNSAATLATTRDPLQAVKGGGVSAVLGGGAGYLFPSAPTAQTQRTIQNKARMAKQPGPGRNVNLGSVDQGVYNNPASTSYGAQRDYSQFRDRRRGVAASPEEMWAPNVQQPINRTGRPLPITEATLETPGTEMVPTERITPNGPDSTRRVSPSIGASEQAATGRHINVEIASAEYQAARNARIEAERRLAALTRSGKATPESISLEQERLISLRAEEVRLQSIAADTLAARNAAVEQAAQQDARQSAWSQWVGQAYEAPPPNRGGFLPPYTGQQTGLGMPPGQTLQWSFPAAQRGFSDSALYGSTSTTDFIPPIVTPPPAAYPQLPAPRGPEIIPQQPIYGPGVDMPFGQRPPGEPIGYTPAPAGLLPPPSFIPAGPSSMFIGDTQVGVRPPGVPGVPVPPGLQTVSPQIMQNQPAGLLPPPSFIPAGPSSIFVGDIQQGIRPPGAPIRSAFGQELEVPLVATPMKTPKKKAQGPVSNTSENPLKRLISEEGGFTTPAAALGAIGALPAATLGVLYRGMLAGGRGLRDALLSPQANTAINALQSAQDKLSQTLDIGALIGKSPALASAVATARTAPGAALSGIDSFLAARFPAVRSALDDIGRFTVSNYGKPEAYLRMQAEAERIGRQAQDDLAGFGLRVVDTIGDDAARMERLYKDMTAESYTPGSNAVDDALVQEGRDLTFRVGQLMNSVGALSDEALRKWGQRYLPRTYEKHLKKANEDGVTSTFARFFEDDPTLAGYYHRGTTEWVTDRQLRNRLASGQGWQALPGPTRRDANGNQLTRIWRDYTEAERDSWGELKNVAVALEKYARAARREVQNGTFLEGVRTGSDVKGAWALDGTSLFGGGPNRPKEFIDSTGQRYVYIGNNNRKGGPIKAYGTLADHYVRDDIAMHVRTANEFGAFKQTTRIAKKLTGVNWWKKLVTIGNPAYFANNFFVNMPMLELAGGSVADLPKAARMLAENSDPLIQQLRERGLIQENLLLNRLAQKTAPVLEKAAAGPSATMSRFANVMGGASNALKQYETRAYTVAGASDDIYRTALVIGLMRRQGITNIDEAVDLANVAFYNRKNVNAPIVDAAEAVIPFAAVTHWTLGSLPSLIYKNPHKAAMLGTIAAAAPMAIDAIYGIDQETSKARKEMLPEQMRPGALPALGFPNAIPAGYDDNGQPLYIDTSTWNPMNAITAEVPVSTAGSIPRALSIGGPLAIAAQLYANKNFYTGRPIVEYDKQGRRMAIDNTLLSQIPSVGSVAPVEVRQFLAQNLIPGIVRYPFEAGRSALAQALPAETSVSMGLTSGESVPISLGTRAARMVGIKSRPLNVPEAFARESGVVERSISDIRKNQALTLRKYQRALENNNQAEAEAEMQKYLEYELYKNQIQQEEATRMQNLVPALRPD